MGVKERRGTRRRSLPFLRSAVLEADGRTHIVVVTDLSPEGAFLSTRAKVDTTSNLKLRMVLPRDGREVAIPCKLVWRSDRFDPTSGRPAGLAVRFHGLEAGAIRRVEEFAAEGFLPAPQPTPPDHVEYRVIERNDIEVTELNRLGLDGWVLATALSSGKNTRLILFRRL